MAYTVSQNTSFYTAASILQKAVSFIYFTIVARAIGVTNTGLYFFAISFTTVFSVVADFGLAPVLTREASKFPDKKQQYFTTIFWIKTAFGFGSYLLAYVAVLVLHYDPILRTLILVSGITMLFDNATTVFSSIFRAGRNLLYESIGIVLSQTITLVIGLVALHLHWPLWSLILAYTVASATTMLYFAICAWKLYGLTFQLAFNKRLAKQLILIAVPFAIAGIVGRLYSYSDSILMSKLLDAVHLGWWSVPYKMTFAFQFIAVAVSTSVYPVMSAWSLKEPMKIADLFERAWKYLFLVSMPLAFGLGVLAYPIITTIYGSSYAPSVPILQILLASLVFGFLSFITGATLNATNNQKKQTILLSCTLGLNVIINIILIPHLATIGAAIAALGGNIFLALGGFWLVRNIIPLSERRIVLAASRVLASAACMGIVLFFAVQHISWIVCIPIGIIVYGLALYIFRGVTADEFESFKTKLFSIV